MSGFEIITPMEPARWEQYLACRYRNLYEPFGLPISVNTSELDSPRDRPEILHRLVLRGGEAAGCGRLDLQPEAPSGPAAQVRYFAVDSSHRGSGAGQALMRHFEDEARRRGVRRIWMEARTAAVNFYARLGYADIGEGPTKYGCIPHRIMERWL